MGRCSVQTKAMVASALLPKGTVHHLIVYGYDGDDGNYNQNNNDNNYIFDVDGDRYIENGRRHHRSGDGSENKATDEDNDDDQINVSILYLSFEDGLGM